MLSAALLIAAAALWSQVPSGTPRFAVASIRPSAPDAVYLAGATVVRGNRFLAIKSSFKDLVAYAYILHNAQVVGGPAWLDTAKFDIVAETDANEKLTAPAAKRMVQGLLADRFHFTFHPGRKRMPIYKLAAGGPLKLARSTGDPNGYGTYGLPMLGRMTLDNANMTEFSNFLRYVLDRPVLDDTRISGRYSFQIDWTPNESHYTGHENQLRAYPRDNEPPDLFTAFREQLGLRLTARQDAAPVLIVDHVDTPSEN